MCLITLNIIIVQLFTRLLNIFFFFTEILMLNEVTLTKLLGSVLDHLFNWETHIDYTLKKISKEYFP